MLRFFKRATILAGVCAVFAIISLSSATADQCDVLHKKWEAKLRAKKESLLTGGDYFGNRMILSGTTEAELKTYCAYRKGYLENEQRELVERAYIDRTCGPSRLIWEECDTECATTHFHTDEQVFAKECAPDQFAERRKNDNLEAHRDEWEKACREARFAQPEDAAKPEWNEWIKSCNKLPLCSTTWLNMEESGLPTKGLTCPPTEAERADFNRPPAPPSPSDRDESVDASCSYLFLFAKGRFESAKLAPYIHKCNAAATACQAIRKTMRDYIRFTGENNKSLDETVAALTCDGKPSTETSR